MERMNSEWLEDLNISGEICPPENAKAEDDIFYRLVENIPPKKEDFYSQHKLNSFKGKKTCSECEFRACSIFYNKEDCERLTKLGKKHRDKRVFGFRFKSQFGVLQRTQIGGSKSHYSWWVSRKFDPADLEECR